MNPRRIYLATGLAQGFFWAGWAIAAVPWWTVILDLSPIRLVLLGTALQLTVLLVEIPTGVVADVFSRKWSVVLSWVVIGVAQILGPVTEIFVFMLAWQVLWAIGFTLQSGADTAWVTDEIGEPDDRLIMRHAIARAVGVVLGILGAFATVQVSVTSTMQIFGAGSLAFGAWLAVNMRETNFSPIDRTQRSSWSAFGVTLREGWRLTRGVKALRVLAVATVLFSMADELIDRLDVRRMVDLGFPDIDGEGAVYLFGAVWILMTVLTIPAMFVADRRASTTESDPGALAGTERLIRSILVVGGIGVFAMAVGFSFSAALVGWIARDVAREVVEPLSIAWANRQAPSEVRATVLSFRSQAAALGEVVGGVTLGLVANYVSIGLAFGIAAALMLLAAAQFRASPARDLLDDPASISN